MAAVELKYKDAVIATLDETGTKTLKTSGKYCEDDIAVSYTKSAVPAETNQRHYEYDNPTAVSGAGNYVTVVSGDETLKQVRSTETLVVIYRMVGTAGCTKSGIGLGTRYLLPVHNYANTTFSVYQSMDRLHADGGHSPIQLPYTLDDDTSLTTGSGRIYITPEGDLRIYGNTSSYPILAGKVVVDVMW